jgi:hypothetical protein
MRFIPNLLFDNCIRDTLMLLKNILGEPRNKLSIILGDSLGLREVLTPFAAFLGGPLAQDKEKLEKPSRRFYKSPRRFGMKCIKT